MTVIKYTPEQHEILDYIGENDGILLVSAGAGTGKSFMAKQVAHLLQPKKALYTAFNKGIVEEGVARFAGTNVECKTLHALAYKYVRPQGGIEDFTYSCITENISYKKKARLIHAVDMFFVSASTDMYDFFEQFFIEDNKGEFMTEMAVKYVEKMVNKELQPTFNFLLKYFHLMLVEGSVDCSYDLVILDEINDTTAVALEIFKLIEAPKKLGLGETNQAIYQFLNLVDGFEELKDVPIMRLTQSFRCSEKIAKNIQSMMRKDVSEDFTFVGTSEPVENNKYLFCTMTNAFIIQEIVERMNTGRGFYLLRKISDIFACPLAIVSVSSGKEPYQKKYKFLMDEKKYYNEQRARGQSFYQYLLDHVDDVEIQNAVKMLISFQRKGLNLFDIYKKAKNAQVDHNYTIATVFTSKGLEYETVHIADDLNSRIRSIRDNGGIKGMDDLVSYRCYYVACSRAGKTLRNAIALSH